MVKKVIGTFVIILFSVSLLGTVGCTKYASQDDLQNLEENRQAAVSAEKDLERVKSERTQLEKERDAKKAELQDAERELERVKNQ